MAPRRYLSSDEDHDAYLPDFSRPLLDPWRGGAFRPTPVRHLDPGFTRGRVDPSQRNIDPGFIPDWARGPGRDIDPGFNPSATRAPINVNSGFDGGPFGVEPGYQWPSPIERLRMDAILHAYSQPAASRPDVNLMARQQPGTGPLSAQGGPDWDKAVRDGIASMAKQTNDAVHPWYNEPDQIDKYEGRNGNQHILSGGVSTRNDDKMGVTPDRAIRHELAEEAEAAARDVSGFNINSTTGGEHSANSRHYAGSAFDINRVGDGLPVSDPRARETVDRLIRHFQANPEIEGVY